MERIRAGFGFSFSPRGYVINLPRGEKKLAGPKVYARRDGWVECRALPRSAVAFVLVCFSNKRKKSAVTKKMNKKKELACTSPRSLSLTFDFSLRFFNFFFVIERLGGGVARQSGR